MEIDDWFAVNNPSPPDDFHTWARPASPPCPNCDCCSAALCEKAVAEDSACHWVGGPSDFDLSKCPCWRSRPNPALEEAS